MEHPLINKRKDIDYFKRVKLVLRICGISLEEKNSLNFKIYSFIIPTFYFTYALICVTEVFRYDSAALVDNLFYQFGTFIAAVKAVVMLQQRIQVGKIMKVLQKEPFLPNPKRGNRVEKKLVQKCLSITRMQEIGYWVPAVVTVSTGIIVVALKRIGSSDSDEWSFPFGLITLFGVTRSPNYELMYSYQAISMSFYGAVFTATDLTIAGILAHLVYQFKILQNNLRNLVTLSYEDMMKDKGLLKTQDFNTKEIDGSMIPWKNLKKCLVDVIEFHSAIIDVANEFENVFSGLMLVVFVNNLALITFMVYRLSMLSLHASRIFTELGEFFCALLQTLIVCYWGEELVTQSQLVGTSVFEMDFTGTDLRFQKALILIIRRSQNPVAATAKKFTIIGMTTFAWMLQKSYAACMVLRKSN